MIFQALKWIAALRFHFSLFVIIVAILNFCFVFLAAFLFAVTRVDESRHAVTSDADNQDSLLEGGCGGFVLYFAIVPRNLDSIVGRGSSK
jgi:hypothetical protein